MPLHPCVPIPHIHLSLRPHVPMSLHPHVPHARLQALPSSPRYEEEINHRTEKENEFVLLKKVRGVPGSVGGVGCWRGRGGDRLVLPPRTWTKPT